MQPDLGAPAHDETCEEEVDAFLNSAGIKPVPAPSSTGSSNDIRGTIGLARDATTISGPSSAGSANASGGTHGVARDAATISARTDSVNTDRGSLGLAARNATTHNSGDLKGDDVVTLSGNVTADGGLAGDGATLCGDVTVGDGSADGEAAAEKDFDKRWRGTEVAAASSLVVLTTAMCR